jgi:plasmid segregation protein ParM
MSDNTQEIEARGNSYSVIYEGNRYIVGEQAEEQSYDVSKTNLLHKLVTYVAITRLAENNSVIQL